nr:acyltransferase [Prevotella sp.]
MMVSATPNVRESNLELYRIIVMLLIVMHHYVTGSDILSEMVKDPNALRTKYLFLTGMWGKTGINCFVLITGYFMCKSHITLHKFLKLLLEILFYNIVISSIFMVTGRAPFSLFYIVTVINPITTIGSGFVSCFLLFFLCIPFLNILIEHMSRSQHIALIGLCLFIYTFIGSIPWLGTTFNYVSWFSVLYFVASYMRKHKLPEDGNTKFWGVATLLSVFFAVISVLFMLYKENRSGIKLDWNIVCYFVSDSNKFFALLVSVCSFMYFKDVKLPCGQSKIINDIASSTFAVLLIHNNSIEMRRWLWEDVFNNVETYHSSSIYLSAIIVPILVFACCIII